MVEGASCSACGGVMVTKEWNSTTNVSVCENVYCVSYSTPIPTGNALLSKARPKRGRVPEWRKRSYSSEMTETNVRLRNLWAKVFEEEED